MDKSPKGKIAIAMSGGVDSSVAAALLLEEGWEVIGVTLLLQGASEAQDGLQEARDTAQQLGMEHFIVDCVEDFKRLILRPAWDEYISARTPSPCVRCNESIKFGLLLEWALKNGCDALATGHYVKLGLKDGHASLLRGIDSNKDQTYFLAGLNQKQLSRLVFPLGGKNKSWVREKAAELGLRCAKRKESQDVCFMLPGMSFPQTLQTLFPDSNNKKDGHIVDWNGKHLAQHDGIHNFTIGQRRGVKVGTGAKAWICGLDAQTGNVYLTNKEEDLMCSEFTVSALGWAAPEPPAMPLECELQVRYRSKPVAAILHDLSGNRGKVVLRQPVKAVAPGQAAVFYNGDWVLGRGWIEGKTNNVQLTKDNFGCGQ